MRRYCRICGFRDAEPGARYCIGCQSSLALGDSSVRSFPKPQVVEPPKEKGKIVRGLARLGKAVVR